MKGVKTTSVMKPIAMKFVKWDVSELTALQKYIIGTFYKKINMCRDYTNMIPGRIALATTPC